MPLASAALLCLVIAVNDGDSLQARCGEPGRYQEVSVRLSAVDAPERFQPFGQRAKQALSELVYRKDVQLNCVETDRYQRQVCQVMVAPASHPEGPRTLDAGMAMITVGMAWWYRAYSQAQTPQERGQYEFAEIDAKARGAGLWRDAEPVPPWEWRRAHPRR